MACNNFVCAFYHTERGKIYCLRYTDTCKNAPACTASLNNSCGQYKWFSCKICGHEYMCFKQHQKGVVYSAEKGNFVPKSSIDFSKSVKQNELINAKRDIYNTAISNYRQGYRTSTTVRQLHDKYGKMFPEFTKEYIFNAVEKSIVQYLKTET